MKHDAQRIGLAAGQAPIDALLLLDNCPLHATAFAKLALTGVASSPLIDPNRPLQPSEVLSTDPSHYPIEGTREACVPLVLPAAVKSRLASALDHGMTIMFDNNVRLHIRPLPKNTTPLPSHVTPASSRL